MDPNAWFARIDRKRGRGRAKRSANRSVRGLARKPLWAKGRTDERTSARGRVLARVPREARGRKRTHVSIRARVRTVRCASVRKVARTVDRPVPDRLGKTRKADTPDTPDRTGMLGSAGTPDVPGGKANVRANRAAGGSVRIFSRELVEFASRVCFHRAPRFSVR